MNAQSLWSGNDYAYVENKGRGVRWYPNAQRVRVIRVFKQREIFNQRDSAYAEVNLIDSDGNKRVNAYDQEIIKRTVRARDILMRWEEYEDEREHRELEREKLEQEREAQLVKEQEEKNRIMDALETKGIERLMVVSVSDTMVVFNRGRLESWLGLD